LPPTRKSGDNQARETPPSKNVAGNVDSPATEKRGFAANIPTRALDFGSATCLDLGRKNGKISSADEATRSTFLACSQDR